MANTDSVPSPLSSEPVIETQSTTSTTSIPVDLYDKDEDVHTQTPIQNRYTFWYHRRGKNPGNAALNYEEGMTQLANFQTVEHFWRIYNHMIRPNDIRTTTDYHLFKHGVSPTWEDPVNKNGGKWMVRLKKGLSSRLWEELVLAIIGEQFDVGHEICGAVVSVRHSEDIISVWNKTADNNEATSKIRDQMRRILKIPPFVSIEYKKHQDSLQDKSSFRNPNVVHKIVPNNRGADGNPNYRGPGQHYGGRGGYQSHGGSGRGGYHGGNYSSSYSNTGSTSQAGTGDASSAPPAEREKVDKDSTTISSAGTTAAPPSSTTVPRVSTGWKSQAPGEHSSSSRPPHAFSPQLTGSAWSKKSSDSAQPPAVSPTNPAHPAPPPAWGTKRSESSTAGEGSSSQSGWWKGSRDAAPGSSSTSASAKPDWSRRSAPSRDTEEKAAPAQEKSSADGANAPAGNVWGRKKPE